jgi:4-hydroxybenzoyl-CoA thioesterase
MSFVNRRPVTIEWGDCDAAGIVFYPRYFAMFDWSTATLLGAAFRMRKPDYLRHWNIAGIPMVDTRASFHIASSFGDEVVIESRVTEIGRSSFSVYHRLLKPGDPEALGAECWEKRVWSVRDPNDPARLRGAPVPDEVRRLLGLMPD